MSDFVEQVATGLAKLRKTDRSLRVFGASSHRYALNPPVSAGALRKKERALGLTLPDDYRQFLTTLGDGGAGPYFGVFPLGFIDDNFGLQSWKKSRMVGDLKRDFPFRRAWKPKAADEPTDEFDAIDGAIPLCHQGCALRDWLVVSGPARGQVWHDASADSAGWWPLKTTRLRRLSFSAWYLDWLTSALR